MELKKGMIVKITRIVDHENEGIDEDLLKYIGKIGVIDSIYFIFNDFNVTFDNEEDCSFYKDEIKIICFEEQSNMLRDNCLWCYKRNKKITIDNKNFSFTMSYCPKCLR